MQFRSVFAGQVVVCDEVGECQQAVNESAGACERVEYVNVFVGESPPEFLAGYRVGGAEYEVHYLYGV